MFRFCEVALFTVPKSYADSMAATHFSDTPDNRVALPSRPMIRMAGENGDGPVKLLQQHDSHKLVRPGHLTE
jgi:hypothetical protein